MAKWQKIVYNISVDPAKYPKVLSSQERGGSADEPLVSWINLNRPFFVSLN